MNSELGETEGGAEHRGDDAASQFEQSPKMSKCFEHKKTERFRYSYSSRTH